MKANTSLRSGRHCTFNLRAHLVFITLSPGKVFDAAAKTRLQELFAGVCSDFGAELLAMHSGSDQVQLDISYPPKIAVSNLVNSLKGASSRVLRKERPDIASKFYQQSSLWSPSYFAASDSKGLKDQVAAFLAQQTKTA